MAFCHPFGKYYIVKLDFFSPGIGVKVHKYLNHHSVVEDWHMWHVPTCVGRSHGSSKWPWLLTNPHCWSTRFCTSWYGYNTSHSFEIPAYIYHINPTSISFNCHSISSGARRLLLIKNILDNNQSSCWWFPPIWKICSSDWIISSSRGEKNKYLKPPPSHFWDLGGGSIISTHSPYGCGMTHKVENRG